MSSFSYRAINQQGKEVTGTVEANTASEAQGILRSRAYQVLSLQASNADMSLLARLRNYWGLLSVSRYLSTNTGDRIMFFKQLALMLRAGNTLMQGLQLCAEMTEKRQLRQSIIDMLVAIQNGSSFANAVAQEKRVFPPMAAKLIASGEASGELQLTLERLAESLQRSHAIRKQFISSLIYPAVVMVVGIGVTLYLAVGIVPKFAKFFEARSQSLPDATQALLDISAWLMDNGIFLGGGIGVLVFMILAWYTTEYGKDFIDRCMLYAPLLGKSIQTSAMAQMGWTMSMLLASGLTVLEALRVMSDVMENSRLGRCFSEASDQILAGRNLAVGLDQPHLPVMVKHMAGIGERSGELEHVMKELGQHYQDLTETRIKRMIALIEPALILFIGGTVGFVYYALFSAMLQASTR